MSDDVQLPGRFVAAALLVGLSWYGLALVLAPPPRPWEQLQTGSQLAVAACFGAGVLVPAWLLRRRLAGARPV